jgi:hypothetical protein
MFALLKKHYLCIKTRRLSTSHLQIIRCYASQGGVVVFVRKCHGLQKVQKVKRYRGLGCKFCKFSGDGNILFAHPDSQIVWCRGLWTFCSFLTYFVLLWAVPAISQVVGSSSITWRALSFMSFAVMLTELGCQTP